MKKILMTMIFLLIFSMGHKEFYSEKIIDYGTVKLSNYSSYSYSGNIQKHKISIVFNYTALDFPYKELSTHK